MGVVDIYDIELFYNLLILFLLLLFELWHDLLSKVDGENVVDDLESFDVFIGLKIKRI